MIARRINALSSAHIELVIHERGKLLYQKHKTHRILSAYVFGKCAPIMHYGCDGNENLAPWQGEVFPVVALDKWIESNTLALTLYVLPCQMQYEYLIVIE